MPVQVYDATSFLKEHPGGGDSILLVAGTDATEEFDAIHSQKAKQQLLSFVVGRLANTKIGGLPSSCPRLFCWQLPGLWMATNYAAEAGNPPPSNASLAADEF